MESCCLCAGQHEFPIVAVLAEFCNILDTCSVKKLLHLMPLLHFLPPPLPLPVLLEVTSHPTVPPCCDS